MTRLLIPADHDADTLPDGLRISTDCPARRVREMVKPDAYPPFDRGVGMRGNDIEALVLMREFGMGALGAAYIFGGRAPRTTFGAKLWKSAETAEIIGRVDLQVPLPVPGGGVSHVDWVLTGDSASGVYPEGVYELKSGSWRLPEPEHVRVVQRRQWLAERAGSSLAGMDWFVLLVDPASYRISGPFPVTLTEERAASITAEFYATVQLLARLDDVDLDDAELFAAVGLACTCGSCFEAESQLVADAALESLMEEYRDALVILEHPDVVDAAKAVKRLKESMREHVPAGAVIEGAGVRVKASQPKSARRVAWDKAVASGVLERAVGADGARRVMDIVEAEGYASETTPAPSLRVTLEAAS